MSQPRPGASLPIVFAGSPIRAVPGETVAAALIAHGVLAQGQGKDGTPRGHYCGMGVCHDCLVVIDGHAGQRACLTRVEPGMTIEPQPTGRLAFALARADLAPVRAASAATRVIDILIVGAGPAGLEAARAAANAGARVLLLDERPAPGGQFYKQDRKSVV